MTLDRTEIQNVAAQNPSITQDLAAQWDAWKVRTGVRTWRPGTQYRPT
jgi:hypothetical protein